MKDTEQIFIDQSLTTMLVKKSKYVPGFVGSVIGVYSYTSLHHGSNTRTY